MEPLFEPWLWRATPTVYDLLRGSGTPKKGHWHKCPYCHRAHPCDMNCTIEPDLEGDYGEQFGAHCACSDPLCQQAYRAEHEGEDELVAEILGYHGQLQLPF